jgi:uncharacterized protein (DUF433 family)
MDAVRSSMVEVRKALASIREHGQEVWSPYVRIFVDRTGRVHFLANETAWSVGDRGQAGFPQMLNLLAEFHIERNVWGPDLVRPRPHLRIVPGKLSGEPHIENTRIGSRTIASLIADGLSKEKVTALYPDLPSDAVDECIDLEKQLQSNLLVA